MTLLPQLTGKNTGGQGQKPATCPAGVWVKPCLWATVYIRKSQGRGDDWPTACKGTKDKDQSLQREGNTVKEASVAEQDCRGHIAEMAWLGWSAMVKQEWRWRWLCVCFVCLPWTPLTSYWQYTHALRASQLVGLSSLGWSRRDMAEPEVGDGRRGEGRAGEGRGHGKWTTGEDSSC